VWLKGKWLTVIESGYEIHDIIDHGLTANAVKQRARMKGIRT
jgi:hypothetical protein